MGSVPNCRKKIANRYGIRWFKCKLKPPKKYQEKWENAYLAVKGSPASGALSWPQTPGLQSNVSAN